MTYEGECPLLQICNVIHLFATINLLKTVIVTKAEMAHFGRLYVERVILNDTTRGHYIGEL